MIDAGRVTVDGGPAMKPTTLVHPGQALNVEPPPRPYVSRGGEKLAAGLRHFGVAAAGRRALDAGASTGGFTDCLLQEGAAHVTAVDVGYGQLAHRVRQDPRVTVVERTNVRDLRPDDLPGAPPDLVVADLSFISLRAVLPALRRVAADDAEAVVLVKPQFEAPADAVEDGGVVRDPQVWTTALRGVVEAAAEIGWGAVGVVPSPLQGPAGNVEFLVHLRSGSPAEDLEARIAAATSDASTAVTTAVATGATSGATTATEDDRKEEGPTT